MYFDDRTYFANALVCENGHLISGDARKYPSGSRYCPQCHAPILNACPHCRAPIHGTQYMISISRNFAERAGPSDLFPDVPEYSSEENEYAEAKVDSYCPYCGKPYPWTEKLLSEAGRLVDLMDELTDGQKEQLKATFPDLICETPHAQSAACLASSLLRSVSDIGVSALRRIFEGKISDALSELLGWK